MSGANPVATHGPMPGKLHGITPGWVLLTLGRVVLGGIFIYAAYTKLRVPWMIFAMSVESYKILPAPAVMIVARSLPWVELFLGILLVLGWGLRWVSALSAGLLVVFSSAMAYAQFHGLAIDCGCFGIGEKLGPKTFVRDGLLIALAIAVAVGAFLYRRSARRSVL